MVIRFKWQSGTYPASGKVFADKREIGTVYRDPINKLLVAQITVTGITHTETSATKLKKQISDWYDSFMAEMVTVQNLMSRKDVKIRRSDVGTCCDPSTERYWTM